MLVSKSRLGLLAAAVLALVPRGDLAAQEAKPATVAEATAALDLATFPLMPDAKVSGPRRLAGLGYRAKGTIRAGYEFQKKELESRGWKELPVGYLSDGSCSGAFGKDGFTVSVSAGPSYGKDSAGMVQIQMNQLGNVDVSKLPVPTDAKLLYSFPATTAFVAEKSVKETSAALRKLLIEQGWEPYGAAGDNMFFKKNAVQLSARPFAAPAQGGKTMIQLSSTLLSADLPAPPDATRAAYADTTKTLSIDVDMTPNALFTFYSDALGKSGWKQTTDRAFQTSGGYMVIFRNEAKDICQLKMQQVHSLLRATIDFQTSAEFEAFIKQAEEEETKQMAEVNRRKKMDAANRVTIAIAVLADAKDVERRKSRLAFKLAAGKGKAAVQQIQADLLKNGWKEESASLKQITGSVILTKEAGVSVTVIYVDTGADDAEITISTFGAEIATPETK